MKVSTIQNRLKAIMEERNLRQIDILNLVLPLCQKYKIKMNKSDISQYCAGKTEPNTAKLIALAEALEVNEVWLMGYDVSSTPREDIRTQSNPPTHDLFNIQLSKDESILIETYRTMDTHSQKQLMRLLPYYKLLSAIGQKKVLDNTGDLAKLYPKTQNPTDNE